MMFADKRRIFGNALKYISDPEMQNLLHLGWRIFHWGYSLIQTALDLFPMLTTCETEEIGKQHICLAAKIDGSWERLPGKLLLKAESGKILLNYSYGFAADERQAVFRRSTACLIIGYLYNGGRFPECPFPCGRGSADKTSATWSKGGICPGNAGRR